MFVHLHVDTLPAEGYAFRLQAEALFESVFSGEFDGAPRAQDPMPGESVRAVQGAGSLAGSVGDACGGGDRSVAADFAVWDFRDLCPEPLSGCGDGSRRFFLFFRHRLSFLPRPGMPALHNPLLFDRSRIILSSHELSSSSP